MLIVETGTQHTLHASSRWKFLFVAIILIFQQKLCPNLLSSSNFAFSRQLISSRCRYDSSFIRMGRIWAKFFMRICNFAHNFFPVRFLSYCCCDCRKSKITSWRNCNIVLTFHYHYSPEGWWNFVRFRP